MTLLAFGIFMRNEFWKSFAIGFISILSAIVIMIVMFVQFETEKFTLNIGRTFNLCELLVIDTHKLFGISGDNVSKFSEEIRPMVLFLLAATVIKGLKIWHNRIRKGNPLTVPDVVFKKVSRANSDESFLNLLKFFINYGFYKFGIEVTLIMLIIVMFTRLDSFTIPYIFWFILLTFRNRDKIETLWRIVTCCVWLSITIQGFILGFFNILNTCLQESTDKVSFPGALMVFFIEFIAPLDANPRLIVFDFILLILMTSQVFAIFELLKAFNDFFNI